jgi:hypothetical protein
MSHALLGMLSGLVIGLLYAAVCRVKLGYWGRSGEEK